MNIIRIVCVRAKYIFKCFVRLTTFVGLSSVFAVVSLPSFTPPPIFPFLPSPQIHSETTNWNKKKTKCTESLEQMDRQFASSTLMCHGILWIECSLVTQLTATYPPSYLPTTPSGVPFVLSFHYFARSIVESSLSTPHFGFSLKDTCMRLQQL